jgi:hypothetical protein
MRNTLFIGAATLALRITGNYTANDCIGSYNGGFVYNKQ